MPELLEENLSASLLVALRDDSKKHAHQILESLEELEGQVHAMKRAMKRSGGGTEGVVGTVSLDVLLERVVGVAGRLEAVQVHTLASKFWRKNGVNFFFSLITKIFAAFSFKTKNLYKILDQNIQRFAKSKKCKVEARTNVEVPKIFERVVGVAGRLEAVQILHLYAANIGAKMTNFDFMTFYKNFWQEN